MPNKQVVLHVNDVDVNLVDIGDRAPTLVFLHYWGGSSRTWVPVMERLASTHRCIAIDFRGWGQSSKDAKDYRLDALATDVLAIVEKLGLNELFIVGHSMGGKVAQLVGAPVAV